MTFTSNGDACPYCHGKDLRRFEANAQDVGDNDVRVNILECNTCEFAWQWPNKRAEKESIKYFAHKYESKNSDSYFDPNIKKQICMLECDFLNSIFSDPGTLLDIGAGDGSFIEIAASRGWNAIGIDPAAKITNKKLSGGAKLLRGTIDQIDQSSEFDVVTLWDVIEHVDTPLEIIESVFTKIKRNGYLVMETGNYQSADRINGGDDWWAYQLDHRWYHSPPILEALMRRVGFENFVYAERVFRPWWKGTPRYTGPSTLAHVKSAIRRPHESISLFQKFLALRRCSLQWPKWSGLPIFTIAGQRID